MSKTHSILLLDDYKMFRVAMREFPVNGDMNWIIPNKILALAGPTESLFPLEDFIDYAKATGITQVIRLNRSAYAASPLRESGIAHRNLFMMDGHIPSPKQIFEFCKIADRVLFQEGGRLAVHCMAGLGRTGTMIAIYLIYKYRVEAVHVIAYLRMMRPGSILAIQTGFLQNIQYLLRREPIPEESHRKLIEYYPNEFRALERFMEQIEDLIPRSTNASADCTIEIK